jgi:hypothetical protein
VGSYKTERHDFALKPLQTVIGGES